MPGHHRVESVTKALRRKAQLQRWSTQQSRHSTPGSASPSPSFTPHGATAERRVAGAPHSAASEASSMTRDGSRAFAAGAATASPSPRATANSLLASQTLQHAYQHRDATAAAAQASPLQRRLLEVLRTSASRAETVEAFFLVAGSDREAVTPATAAQFVSAVLRHNVAAQMGTAAYEAAMADAVGAAKGGRWSRIEPAEARAFALYHAQRLERYAVKGTVFDEKRGLTVEGADNALVAMTLHQLQKHASRALPVPVDVLEELTHLDISWTAALRVYAYARELVAVDPPSTMTARVMGLMTGYRTNGLGSRPWAAALQLYAQLQGSGYEVPLDAHAAALDAIWRSAGDFAVPHRAPTAAAQAEMWAALVRIRDSVDDAAVTGEAGCRFSEALVKAASAAGRWEAAVQLLGQMDVSLAATSARLLIPTAETFLYAMAACNVAHNAAYATSLLQTFGGLYTLRSAHPEALACYLQSLRHVRHLAGHVGLQVEALVTDGQGLDRPCCVACLQLLASPRVRTGTAEKWRLAQQLLDQYDSNPWPQNPQARQAELQTVFRCCHLIAAASAVENGAAATACPLVPELRRRLVALFGASSPECQWLADTEVYSLLTTHSWRQALEIFARQVSNRPPSAVAELPIPLRQARQMLAQTLVRCGRAQQGAENGAEDHFLLDEDRQEESKVATHDYLVYAVRTVRDVYAGTADTPPRGLIGELLLLQALLTTQAGERQRVALEAMRELACGVASGVTPRIVDLASQALGLTEEHVQSVLVEGSAQLRGKALENGEKHLSQRAPCLERVFL